MLELEPLALVALGALVGRPAVADVGARRPALDEHPQDPVQLVEDLHGRRRVVDARGQGPLGDVDELTDPEGGVLAEGALVSRAMQ